MNTEIKPGYGYRLLSRGETILPGDQIWLHEEWVHSTLVSTHVKDGTYRRKIDPGEGFEIVPPNEIETADMDYTRDGVNWESNDGKACQRIDYYQYPPLTLRRRKYQPTSGQWVKVADRLPDKAQRVLFWPSNSMSGERIATAYFDGRYFDANPYPTHWMPLPPAPESQKSDAEKAWDKYAAKHMHDHIDSLAKSVFIAGFESAKLSD